MHGQKSGFEIRTSVTARQQLQFGQKDFNVIFIVFYTLVFQFGFGSEQPHPTAPIDFPVFSILSRLILLQNLNLPTCIQIFQNYPVRFLRPQ